MTPEEYINAFTKYISKIIVPNNPEINTFEVKLRGSKQWTFNGKWSDVYEITFYCDDINAQLEDNIMRSLATMRKIFDVRDELLIDWDMVYDSSKRTPKRTSKTRIY